MQHPDHVVAVFKDHEAAEAAVKQLVAKGFEMRWLSVVGRGYHLDEHLVGFYNAGDRVQFWGTRGAFWGGLWSLFFGGMFLSVPAVGSVIVLGYLAAAALSAIEGAVVVGGVSALGAALYSLGIPHDSVLQYETDIAADSFVVMVHGTASRTALAKSILADAKAMRIDIHDALNVPQSVAA